MLIKVPDPIKVSFTQDQWQNRMTPGTHNDSVHTEAKVTTVLVETAKDKDGSVSCGWGLQLELENDTVRTVLTISGRDANRLRKFLNQMFPSEGT